MRGSGEPEPRAGQPVGEPLWVFASAREMGRRQFLRLMLAGGAAAVPAACAGMETARPTATEALPDAAGASLWFKDPAPFIQRGKGLEARIENMQGLITPNRLFFVRNNSVSIDVDAATSRLSVEVDAVAEPLRDEWTG